MRFYMNKNEQKIGYNEIHHATCFFLPFEKNRIDLGEFTSINDAIQTAKLIHKKVVGCFFCTNQLDNE
jgi:hypothetical protein